MQRRDVLDGNYLYGAMFAALLLHALGYYMWSIAPKQEVINIPVRVLNIKLGDLETTHEVDVKLLEPAKDNSNKVEDTLSKLVRSEEDEAERNDKLAKSIDKAIDTPEKDEKKPEPVKADKPAKSAKPQKLYKFDVRTEGKKTAAPVMEVSERQFVRDLPAPNVDKSTVQNLALSKQGNSKDKQAEVMASYEQQISLWIQKFKVYPEAAKEAEAQGETVARIRIDRRGNIRYYTLERSTGHILLDKAAIDMIKRANPVPSVPTNYPAGDMLEFRIPIRFNVQ